MSKHSVRSRNYRISTFALTGLIAVLVLAGATSFVKADRLAAVDESKRVQPKALAILDVDDELVPPVREAAPPPPVNSPEPPPPAPAAVTPPAETAPPAPPAETAPASAPTTAAAPPPATTAAPAPAAPSPAKGSIDAYRGMGIWIDLYDFALRGSMNIPESVDEMARHGVDTLYLQTGRWKDVEDIVQPAKVASWIEAAHAKGIKVVGWYVPGFGNIDRDIKRSVMVMEFTTPNGQKFDGFAPDIETREEVGGSRDRYNAGVATYSKRLRAALPDAVLGAITDDPKNNLRAPERHVGFPWGDIAAEYDVVLPMTYWTVTKPKNGGCGGTYDAESYIKEAVALTKKNLGADKPVHPIGGIADCVVESEVAGYARAAKEVGIGGSFYDFVTIQNSRVPIWKHLATLN